MSTKYITKELWEHVEKQKTKIAKRVYNVLNHDNFYLILDGDIFYFEQTWSGATIPNYCREYVIKWGKKQGYTYLYHITRGK